MPIARQWWSPLAAAAVVLGALLVSEPAASASTESTAPATALRLVWSDNFNGTAGSAPSSARWNTSTGGSGFGNKEKEYYSSSTRNVRLDGHGNLEIVARKEKNGKTCWYGPCLYTSGKLTTAGKFTAQYGRVEARMKLPIGQGMWPAFWMLGSNIGSVGWPTCGEIDVMENLGSRPSSVGGTLHGPGYGLGASYTLPNNQRFADGYHTFAIDWAVNSVSFLVDGHVYAVRTPSSIPGKTWVFNHPFFLILNLAVGGNWPGDPNSTTVFPQTLSVDYVAVYAR